MNANREDHVERVACEHRVKSEVVGVLVVLLRTFGQPIENL